LLTTLAGAVEGSAFTIPASLGAATLVYAQVGMELLPAGMFALLLSMLWIHASTASSKRPMLYAARFFEATTLAAMMAQVADQLPAWGLADTTGVRLAFLCIIGAGAGVTVGLLYLLRADRFTRFIPSPVFSGFSNSIAIALLVSQSRRLWDLLTTAPSVTPAASIALAVLATALFLRLWRPRWPSTAFSIGVGLLLGLAWWSAGRPTPQIGGFGWSITLPIALADFKALAGPGVLIGSAATTVVTSAGVLGAMMFINTTMTAQVMKQSDRRRNFGRRTSLWSVAGMTLAGLVGSVPLSGSMSASLVASRDTAVTPSLMRWCALVVALVYLSGVVGLIPLAAVSAALLCEAWFLFDRTSVRLFGDWLRRRTMTANGREDLALVVMVMATAVLLNMVAAVFVGLLTGLVLFAARNARRPVRNIWSGLQLTSNCARSRAELNLLAEYGKGIRVYELEGDLFFGSTESLERSLEEDSDNAAHPVIDWSRVRHIDTSVALAIAQFERRARHRGITPIHAAADMQGDHIVAVLLQNLPQMRMAPDLDRALEMAENDLIQAHASSSTQDTTAIVDPASLFQGLEELDRARLESFMTQRLYRKGDVILKAGEPGDELMLVLHGSASIVARSPDGKDVRLAGVRRGATLGDIAFLDHARRSASVIAEQDTTVAVLRRETYDLLCKSEPRMVQQLLANITLSLAARLRHTNQLALARQGQN
jgi:SulP family sulfate permease